MLAKPSVETLWRDSDAAIIEGREDRFGVAVVPGVPSLGGMIANAQPRAAYGRAVGQIPRVGARREASGCATVSPLHVAGYIWTHPGVGYRP